MISLHAQRLSASSTASLRSPARFLLAALSVALVLAGCAASRPEPIYGWNWTGPAPEGYYLVRSGDSLSTVAERHGVPKERLAKWNRLRPPYAIYSDTLLRIRPPDGRPPRRQAGSGAEVPRPTVRSRIASPRPATQSARAEPESATGDRGGDARPGGRRGASGLAWEWPLHGRLEQEFEAGDRTQQGIRIRGRPGEPVKSAADGVVVYSGSGLKGYGNLIIVKHNNKYLSAYGFNRRLLASEGDRVVVGQAIAEVGQGPEGRHLLHFEVRRSGTAVDPILYLPARD
jgi:lipoprotein NlpD